MVYKQGVCLLMSLYDSVLARRDYVSDIRMVIDSNIVEYDIEKANLNILYKYGKIDDKTYDMVLHMDRYNRQYFIDLTKSIKNIDKMPSHHKYN